MELVLWRGRSGFIPDWYLLFVHLHFKTPVLRAHLAPLAMISQPVPFVQKTPSSSTLGLVLPLTTSPILIPISAPQSLSMGSPLALINTPAPLLILSTQIHLSVTRH